MKGKMRGARAASIGLFLFLATTLPPVFPLFPPVFPLFPPVFQPVFPESAQAADFDIPDGDAAALIAAIRTANTNGEPDTIRLAPFGRYSLSAVDNTDGDKGPNGLPVILNDAPEGAPDLALEGRGARLTRTGEALFRFLMIGREAEVTISGLGFENGACPADGGAIQARWQMARLTLDRCVFDGNARVGTGPEDGGGAVMVHEGTLILKDCRFRNNTASVGGAVKVLLSDLTVLRSVFAGNRAVHPENGSGGAIYIDGALGDNGAIRVDGCRFLENSAMRSGGGFFNFLYNHNETFIENSFFGGNEVLDPPTDQWPGGGGLWTRGGTFDYPPLWSDGGANATRTHVVNCAFYRNRVRHAHGLGGAIASGAMDTALDHLTLSENSAGWAGGGVHADARFPLSIRNTIFDRNIAHNGGNDWNAFHHFSGEAAGFDAGGNLQFLTDGSSGLPDTIPVADPRLLPPALHGGPAETLAPAPDSPAIDGAVAENGPSADARGQARPVGDGPDIGAHEYLPAPPMGAPSDTPVSASGYLGGAGEENQGNAILIQADGGVAVAGSFSSLPETPAPLHPLGAVSTDPAMPAGAIIRLSPDGREVIGVIRLGAVVDDLAEDPEDGALVAVGDFGLVRLSPDGATLHWSKPPDAFADPGAGLAEDGDAALYGNGRRVATGQDGAVAVQLHERYFVFDRGGGLLSSRLIVREDANKDANPYGVGGYNHRVEDIAVDAGRGLVFVTGFSQRDQDYQCAFLSAFSFVEKGDDGRDRAAWIDYNWWASAAAGTGLTADTRGVRVEMGPDGALYFIGLADGGNNIFTRNPKHLTADINREGADSAAVNNVVIDRFNNGAGAGAGAYGYLMKADPGTGQVYAGQFQYSSAGVNEARSFRLLAIAADAGGDAMTGGASEYEMPDRAALTVNGQPVGDRATDENAFIRLTPDLTRRRRVACLTGAAGGQSAITAIASAGGRVAVLGNTLGEIMAVAPPAAGAGAGARLFFAVWPPPPAPAGPGDIDCSGAIDLADLIGILRVMADAPAPNSRPDCSAGNGDVSENGRAGLEDAILILRLLTN